MLLSRILRGCYLKSRSAHEACAGSIRLTSAPTRSLKPQQRALSKQTSGFGRYDDPFQRMRTYPPPPPQSQVGRVPSSQYGRVIEHQPRSQNRTRYAFPRSTKIWMAVGSGSAIVFYVANQEVVPVSGRKRFNFVKPEWAEMQAAQQFQQILQSEAQQGRILPEYDPRVRQVKRVLQKLITGGDLGNGATGDGSGWEVHVIDDPNTSNAFVLPGGKVFVYSGILPICRGDDGLAAVLGHEIAHNIAQHSAERMSSMLPITLLSYGFYFLDATGYTGGLGFYVGNQLLDLIFSRPAGRQQESEADYIGLLLMAQSCYNPEAAVGLWQRMDAAQHGAPPEWLSTHPSNANRVKNIQEWLPKAQEAASNSGCGNTQAYLSSFNNSTVFKQLW